MFRATVEVTGREFPMLFGHDSIRVAEYILWLARESKTPVTPMQLLKLVYICHGWMIGLYSRPLIVEPVEAWQYGPVVPSVYQRFKQYGGGFIKETPERPTCFDPDEESVIRQVWDHYGRFSGVQLSTLTHKQGTPWDTTWKSGGRGGIISSDLIEQHYKQLSASAITQ